MDHLVNTGTKETFICWVLCHSCHSTHKMELLREVSRKGCPGWRWCCCEEGGRPIRSAWSWTADPAGLVWYVGKKVWNKNKWLLGKWRCHSKIWQHVPGEHESCEGHFKDPPGLVFPSSTNQSHRGGKSDQELCGQFVIVGHFLEVVGEDIRVNAMRQSGNKNLFMWPQAPDAIFYNKKDIVAVIS